MTEAVQDTEDMTENAASEPEDRAELLLDLAISWGRAFTGRDGAAMAALLTDSGKMEENGYEKMDNGSYDVGWSSPWPWEETFRVNYAYDRDEIVVYYYAMTSDPTVTVWKQVLTAEKRDGNYRVADWTTDMEPVGSAADFRDRYHYESQEEYGITEDGYRFRYTPLDWFATSGTYDEKTLADRLLGQEADGEEEAIAVYQTPETAAQRQLNLVGGRAVRVESPDDSKVCLRWEFADGQTDVICLKHAGLLSDGSGRESSLWLVEDILEEQVWQSQLTLVQLGRYYEDNPEKLDEGGMQGMEGLLRAQRGKDGAVRLAVTDDNSVALYGLAADGNTRGIFLADADGCQYLDLVYAAAQSVLPVMDKADYDGDGQDELMVVLHVDTGTEYSVEQLFCMEKQKDGGWTAIEYLPEDYIAQLAADVEYIYDKGSNTLRCKERSGDLLLGEEDLTQVISGKEEVEGITMGNLVYFSFDGGKISVYVKPRIQIADWAVGGYPESVLWAQVNYDGKSFRLSDYGTIQE